MRVGLFLGNQLPEIGGNYTFENEILNLLDKFGNSGTHSFTLFALNNKFPKEVTSFKNIQFKTIHIKDGKQNESRIELQAKRLMSKIGLLQKKGGKSSQEAIIQQEIINLQIDMIWNVTQTYLTMEIPFIATVLDLQHRIQPYFPEVTAEGQWKYREEFFSETLRRASIILVGTEIGKAEIEKFYQVPPERIKVLPFPTPQFALNAPKEINKTILKKYNIPSRYLFYPAQFWPHKNHAGCLFALKHLRDEYGLILPIVFTGSDKGNQNYIKQLADELNLTSQVYFLGFVPRDDLVSLYKNALGLLFLSFFGPDNLPPLEAFALGCPVIASDIPGAQEQLGEAALLVNPKDKKQIALAIRSVCNDLSLRSSLIKAGHLRASRWTGEHYISCFLAILDSFRSIRHCWSSTEAYHQK